MSDLITGLSPIENFVWAKIAQDPTWRDFRHAWDCRVFPRNDDASIDEIPLSIHTSALQLVTDRFVRQLRADLHFPEINDYYARIVDNAGSILGDRSDEVFHFPPNALAILFNGILGFSNELPQKSQSVIDFKLNDALVKAAKNYAWKIYIEVSPIRRVDIGFRQDGVEVLSSNMAAKNAVTGINNIEAHVRHRLTATGNNAFIGNASLGVFKARTTIDMDDTRPVGTALSQAMQSRQWIVNKRALEVIVDKFSEQMAHDMRTHETLFTEKIFSPAAKALLLYGIEYIAMDTDRQASQVDTLFGDILHAVPTFAPEARVILDEAKEYGRSVFGFPAEPATATRLPYGRVRLRNRTPE